MNEQDQRAIETMIGIGLEREELYKLFSQFKKEDIDRVYREMKKEEVMEKDASLSINCS